MEGVLVSAKRDGSTVTTTVVSDAKGQYAFPRSRLESGRYTIQIRAVGYDLETATSVQVDQAAKRLDLKLQKTQDLASQLTNAEWLMSMTGTSEQKARIAGCTSCHTLERVVRSRYTVDQWPAILRRMSTYAPGAIPLHPQVRPGTERDDGMGGTAATRPQAEFLASINLSAGRWQYALKTLPRLKGRATRVIITEYDLPRPNAQPHDAIVDRDGTVWYSDFGNQFLGHLDPKTGKATEYPVPVLKPGSPTGGLDVEFDADGNVWLGMMLQGGLAKFDKKAQRFQTYPLSKDISNDRSQQAMVAPWSAHRDGKVWLNDVGWGGVRRVDLHTGQFDSFDPYKEIKDGQRHFTYGINADSHNNLFANDFPSHHIVKVDAKTGHATVYPTPTSNSAPRRGHIDAQDRIWFAEYQGHKLAMLDTRTGRFQEWMLPTPFTAPYDAILDKNGEVWSGGMSTDRVTRLDPKTGDIVEYQLPTSTNVRRVDVDNATTPVTFWIGNNNAASLIKVEPID
jgi:streptogramin lyase